MTTSLNQKTDTVRDLIECCYESQVDFMTASEMVKDESLKRLFGIYAQQRYRFAEELRELEPRENSTRVTRSIPAFRNFKNESELLQFCLEQELRTVSRYREALSDRKLTTKTHFLVSAQLALLERVHTRIQHMTPVQAPSRVTLTQ